jgi:hypothetical protein
MNMKHNTTSHGIRTRSWIDADKGLIPHHNLKPMTRVRAPRQTQTGEI